MNNNLKILATVMCYIVRSVNDNSDKNLNFPLEWQGSLHNDQKMKAIYENQHVNKQLKECKVMQLKTIFLWAIKNLKLILIFTLKINRNSSPTGQINI